MPSATAASHTVVATGTHTLVSVSVVTPPSAGRLSVHDCVDPGQASLMNCVYPPTNLIASNGPLVVKNGLCVKSTNDSAAGSGSVTINYA